MAQHAAKNQDAPLNPLLQEGVEKASKKRQRRWLIVLVVALVVFIGALIALGVLAYSYIQGQQKYDAVAEKAELDTSQITDDAQLDKLTVDWDALLKANPDTVAWIYMPDTPINYPVVQGKDNDHYLYYDFDGDAGWLAEYGAIFVDFRNKKGFSDPSNFIYGHHMNDGSMFAVISSFEEKDAFDNHRIAYLLTPRGNYRLRSFSIVHCDAYDPIVETVFASRKDMTKYVQDKMDRSLVKVDDVPKAADMRQIFALATCDSYSSGRDVLFMYVLDSTAEGLSGEIGLEADDESTWLVDDLEARKE